MKKDISLYGDRGERFDKVHKSLNEEIGTELSQSQVVAILMDRVEERNPTLTA